MALHGRATLVEITIGTMLAHLNRKPDCDVWILELEVRLEVHDCRQVPRAAGPIAHGDSEGAQRPARLALGQSVRVIEGIAGQPGGELALDDGAVSKAADAV